MLLPCPSQADNFTERNSGFELVSAIAFAPVHNLTCAKPLTFTGELDRKWDFALIKGGQKCHSCHVLLTALSILFNAQMWLVKVWKATTLTPPAGHRCCSCAKKKLRIALKKKITLSGEIA